MVYKMECAGRRKVGRPQEYWVDKKKIKEALMCCQQQGDCYMTGTNGGVFIRGSGLGFGQEMNP